MRRLPRPCRRAIAACVGAALAAVLPRPAPAHEVPATVTVRAFVKPEADRLRLLVRAPLVAMRDMDFPLQGPGYLDLARAQPPLRDAARLWIADYVAIFAGDTPLGEGRIVAVRASIPSDPSFRSFETALSHLRGPRLPVGTQLPPEQALLDVLIEYPLPPGSGQISIDPEWAHLGVRTTTVLHFLPPGGAERVLQFTGDPGRVKLDPRWHQSALRFVALGFGHILGGIDHLLFVLCLVIPFRRFGPLVPVVTSFTLAHSITLVGSALGLAPRALWFPPLVETLIALSIVFMAFENIVGARLHRRWLLAFGFGLVHGFGFSFLLRDSLQFAGSHLLTSLVSFNVGVELGQLLVLLLAIPVLELLFRRAVAERVGTILLSALIAHTAWHWMTDRGTQLAAYSFEWPVPDLALLAGAVRWAMLLVVAGGAAWGLSGLFGRAGEAGGDGAGAGPLPKSDPAPGAPG